MIAVIAFANFFANVYASEPTRGGPPMIRLSIDPVSHIPSVAVMMDDKNVYHEMHLGAVGVSPTSLGSLISQLTISSLAAPLLSDISFGTKNQQVAHTGIQSPSLGIGSGSDIQNQFHSVDFVRRFKSQDGLMILGESEPLFVRNYCMPEYSIIRIPVELVRAFSIAVISQNVRIGQDESFSVTFGRSKSNNAILTVPFGSLKFFFSRLPTGSAVVSNCSQASKTLPNIILRFPSGAAAGGGVGVELRLTPRDYLRILDHNDECEVLISEAPRYPRLEKVATLNLLRLDRFNIRSTNNHILVCTAPLI